MIQPIKINKSEIKGNDSFEAYHNLVKSGCIKPDEEQEKVALLLRELGKKIEKYTPEKGLFGKKKWPKKLGKQGIYIHGDVGRGKSMLMDLFYITSKLESKRRVHFHAFMLEIHKRIFAFRQENIGKKSGKNSDPIAEIAAQVAGQSQLLCFDEFQVSDITDAMILSRLFSELFKRGVVVIATSNVKPEKLYEHGLQRDQFMPFIHLLKEKVEVVSLNSPTDYRLQKLKSVHNLYFTPLGEEAHNYIEKIFADLTNNAIPESTILDVNGRELELQETYGDVAIATFNELCGQPLGAADYIEIAREFSTLMLTEIPKMGAENRNEAKRFITLVDELYEHKVKLICTAEAEPDELYTAGDNSFEFQRTISRLYEMQSEEYLAERKIP